jgi:hypothetical protein
MFFVPISVYVATVPEQVCFIRLAVAFVLRSAAWAGLVCDSVACRANQEDRDKQARWRREVLHPMQIRLGLAAPSIEISGFPALWSFDRTGGTVARDAW